MKKTSKQIEVTIQKLEEQLDDARGELIFVRNRELLGKKVTGWLACLTRTDVTATSIGPTCIDNFVSDKSLDVVLFWATSSPIQNKLSRSSPTVRYELNIRPVFE